MNPGLNALRLLLLAATIVGGLGVTTAQATPTPEHSDKDREKFISQLPKTVLATVGDEKITYGELQQAFRKNMNRKEAHLFEVPKDSVMNFLKLYVNYRLKVHDAIGRKVHEKADVQADIRRNREALATPYYFEKKIVEPNVNTILNRRSHEVKAAIILVGFPQEANADTAEAYARAMEAQKKLQAGTPFDTLVKHYSDDAMSKARNGEIPFTASGFILREVEDAMFSLKPGEYHSKPIRTSVGYFFIKVLRKEALEWRKCSHILLSATEVRDSAATHRLADSIRAAIRNGASFERLAAKYSDDKSSAQNGGSLASGAYSRSLGFRDAEGRLVPEFENTLFNLKEGQISDAVHTVYGQHIIRCDSIIPYSKEAGREDVKKRYKRVYFEIDKRAHLDKLQRERGYGWNKDVLAAFMQAIDTTRTPLHKEWAANVDESLRKKALYKTGANTSISVGAFVDSLSSRNDSRNTPLKRDGLEKAMLVLADEVLMADVTKDLEKEYADFGSLMREFRDGILIFKVEDEEVWSRLKFDSTRARAYYDTTKSNYKTDTLYDVSEVYVLEKSAAESIYTQLKNGAAFETLAAENTMRKGFREKNGAWGPISPKRVALVQSVAKTNVKPGTIMEPFRYEQGYSVVRLNEIVPPRIKSFEEALPDFAAKFQDIIQKELTEQWLSELRETYPVDVKESEIQSIWGKWAPKG